MQDIIDQETARLEAREERKRRRMSNKEKEDIELKKKKEEEEKKKKIEEAKVVPNVFLSSRCFFSVLYMYS